MSHLDPCTTQSETEVQQIIDLQSIVQSMPDVFFTNLAKVTKSHIPATNAPAMTYVPPVCRYTAWEGWTTPECGEATPFTRISTLAASQSSAPILKCGRPPGQKDSQPQKRKRHKLLTLV